MKAKDFSEIKIEKGIPLVKKMRGFGNEYPWDKMEIGDSFHITMPEGGKISSFQSGIAKNARFYFLYNNKQYKFTTRKDRDGVRVWRTI